MQNILLIVFLSLFLAGCAKEQPTISKGNYSGVESDNVITLLVNQAADVLATKYIPGFVAFNITEEQPTKFGLALEEALSAKGFKNASPEALELSFITDSLRSKQGYFSIRVSDGFTFSWFYTLENDQCIIQGRVHGEDL